MIELTQIQAELNTAPDGFLSLPIDSRIKSRLKVTLDDGRDGRAVFATRSYFAWWRTTYQ